MYFSTLDDNRSLQAKLEEKARDLFKAKPGQAPLLVTRIYRERENSSDDDHWIESMRFRIKEKINNVSEIDSLVNVCPQR
jgi:hypothetical protein